MSDCCDNKACELEALQARQKNVLWIVLGINAVMFLVEAIAGWLAQSNALMADSLDMLGDALVYGFSIYAVSADALWKARAALFKGLLMMGFGLGVLANLLYRTFFPVVPAAGTMGLVGLLALAANVLCLVLLLRHRGDDLNMHSVWLCSRNDVLENCGILAAAALVYWFRAGWPDLLLGGAIVLLLLSSAARVLKPSMVALRPQP